MADQALGQHHRETVRRLEADLTQVRAAPLVRVKVKITVKNAVCEESSATANGAFDCEFVFGSDEWSCSQRRKSHWQVRAAPAVRLERGRMYDVTVRSYGFFHARL